MPTTRRVIRVQLIEAIAAGAADHCRGCGAHCMSSCANWVASMSACPIPGRDMWLS